MNIWPRHGLKTAQSLFFFVFFYSALCKSPPVASLHLSDKERQTDQWKRARAFVGSWSPAADDNKKIPLFQTPDGIRINYLKTITPSTRTREALYRLVYSLLLSNYKTNPSSSNQVRSVSRPGKWVFCHCSGPASHDTTISLLISASWIATYQQLIKLKRRGGEKWLWSSLSRRNWDAMLEPTQNF